MFLYVNNNQIMYLKIIAINKFHCENIRNDIHTLRLILFAVHMKDDTDVLLRLRYINQCKSLELILNQSAV